MIQLTQEHEQVFLQFIKTNPYLYLFYMGDYLAYGFDHPECNYYGEFEHGEISCCILRYKDSVHIGGSHISDEGLAFMYDLFEKKKCVMVNCSDAFIERIMSSPISFKVDICKLSVYKKEYVPHDDKLVERLDMSDVDEYISIIDPIFGTTTNREDFIDDHLQGRSISYCLKVNQQIVSTASITAITPQAAMIIGVATMKEHENKGYASRLIKSVCNEMMKEQIATVLFYTNEVAGRVYHKCGFVDQENYYLLKKLEVAN